MYHHTDSRRGWRTGHRVAPHPSGQPSSAAAKAAAAAKAFHRRAQERVQEIEQRKRPKRREHDQGCCPRIRNKSDPQNDVFRRISHAEHDQCGGVGHRGSILKRLTAGGQRLPRNVRGEAEETERNHFFELNLSTQHTCPSPLSVPCKPAYPTSSSLTQPSHLLDGRSHLNAHVEPDQKGSSACKESANEKPVTLKAHLLSIKERRPSLSQPPFEGGHFLDANTVPAFSGFHPPPPEASSDDHISNQKQICATQNPTLDVKSEQITEIQGVSPVLSPPLPSSSMRCIIGSHTPIHVPRAAFHEAEEPLHEEQTLRQNTRRDPGSVFRSSLNATREDENNTHLCESNAHKILLSLSRSSDRADDKFPRREVWNTFCATTKEGRPSSPDEPPRIQHWHKQSSDSFEPQPTPLKVSYLQDSDGINIDLTSSFTLFNESFDMNLEGLLGPSASFGLGPMRSLSFGLGFGTSVDNGDNPCASSIIIHGQNPNASEVGGTKLEESKDANSLEACKAGKSRGNVQILMASPTPSLRQVFKSCQRHRDAIASCCGVDSSSTMVGRDSLCGSPLMGIRKYLSGTEEYLNEERSGGHTAQCSSSERKEAHSGHVVCAHGNHNQLAQGIDQRLFGAIERHHSVFCSFSYLLPGLKSALKDAKSKKGKTDNRPSPKRLSEHEQEIARRRINSALCAFGGVVIVPADSEACLDEKNVCRMQNYKELTSERYYEDESRLSWEIEEEPPIDVSDSEERPDQPCCHHIHVIDDEQIRQYCESGRQVHEYPSKASLQRSIGTMVYPAVNAFTSIEPGILTPALSEMNNFTDKNKSLGKSTPAKAVNEFSVGLNSFLPMVSPDSVRPGTYSPPTCALLMSRKTLQCSLNYAGGAWISHQQSPKKKSPVRNIESHMTDLLFVEMQQLRPEQYRTVHSRKRKLSSTQYFYPALPLPYGQRKRISNAMFALSKSIPGLTDECAIVLGEARRKNAWDFAVAQLMTQVVVVTHCSAEDSRLDGLSKYLLTLGIAC